ncbi:putative O-linked N-acetylglucosamine transferase (SPINDLY family) [Pseudomonas nitritireducens]|uniref:protein O-GlcNAc transferase n=1 Tax=Pseudomonas nitroreducens TaxID=46680 RepID=A0A7W7P1G1_PSENT|nr:hypothetical protein [Pseudomonas nitritireducens]MBB4863420.1 putative O-linked N-acetylglucosamine transferase (SPINDLY family) [Pseudomonas nitritireducens]
MFWGLVKTLFAAKRPAVAVSDVGQLLAKAGAHRDKGQVLEAIEAFEAVLAIDPYNPVAMNDLAASLMILGREGEARLYFEKAALVDDTFVPAQVNYAASLSESYESARALEILQDARKLMPDAGYIDSAMARIKTSWGEAEEGRELFLSAWLKEFDDARFAENYLFNSCSVESVSSAHLYAEHAFWADTLPDIGLAPVRDGEERRSGRIRIGYLSPDMRQHSVRYFFRPLLEGHDRDRFEIYAYYESGAVDAQTELIRSRCDYFRHIPGLMDADFEKIVLDDDLDILVELAGHTSVNRTGYLRRRLARVQMTALGYPPTTGLSQIDYKVVDKHAAPEGTEGFYSERLLRLPNTFWCFNPLEPTPDPAPPPSVEKGYVTFGCYGNIGKVSVSMLASWREILERVPCSRLIIKSINFQDHSSREHFASRMVGAGIELARVDLVLPDQPAALFSSYAEIDLILDTFPFNGGTTSAFALWMGVPLVTLQGDILLSRMGSSMLREVGLQDLIADHLDDYVERAVALATDTQRLVDIRASMRTKLLASPLGNGQLYASQFEAACLVALESDSEVDFSDVEREVLPESVLVERAATVYRSGNYGAVTRIVRYCLNRYPKCLEAHVLLARVLEHQEGPQQGYDSLVAASQSMERPLDPQVALALARLQILLGLNVEAMNGIDSFVAPTEDAEKYALSLRVYQAVARARTAKPDTTVRSGEGFLSVLVHCDSDAKFAEISQGLKAILPPQSFELLRGRAVSRAVSYRQLLGQARSDLIVLLHEDVAILSPDFHRQAILAMERFDVVGPAGTRQLLSPLWFEVDEGAPSGALILPSGGGVDELCVYSSERYSEDIEALEGGLIVARRSAFAAVELDEGAEDVVCLAEVEWSFRASQAGLRLAAVPGLGVARRVFDMPRDDQWRRYAMTLAEKHARLRASKSRVVPQGVSIPLRSGLDAMLVLRTLYLTDQ